MRASSRVVHVAGTRLLPMLMAASMPPPLPPALAAELCSFAEELAEAARAQILPYWRRPIEVESKHEPDRPEAESPVTVADRNAERAMRSLIEARYPSHGIARRRRRRRRRHW